MRASFHRLDVPVGDAEPLVDARRARGLVLMEPDLHVLREAVVQLCSMQVHAKVTHVYWIMYWIATSRIQHNQFGPQFPFSVIVQSRNLSPLASD